ncbi:MAG: OmpA family protein [Spirochaetaceae bacterium]|jgi:outer membrane protein OmpA-like peptidoglycan-associated protein|nr:OmpA family protein [Spirochaetaceae bacterium]
MMAFREKTAVFTIAFMFTAVLAFSQKAGNSTEPMYIVFPADSSDLKRITGELAIRNSQVFIKIAQILLDNPQYRILIDGHANPVEKTNTEEADSLRPLSLRRAEIAADFLVMYYGVDRRRLIISGAGGLYPFGDTNDPSLNRRVGFFIVTPR